MSPTSSTRSHDRRSPRPGRLLMLDAPIMPALPCLSDGRWLREGSDRRDRFGPGTRRESGRRTSGRPPKADGPRVWKSRPAAVVMTQGRGGGQGMSPDRSGLVTKPPEVRRRLGPLTKVGFYLATTDGRKILPGYYGSRSWP